MSKKIAMISEHASPLADLGSVDSGGQNVYVAHVARNLARSGYQVDVFTRRDSPELPEVFDWQDGVRVIHVPAGRPEFVRKEDLLDHMLAFTDYMISFFKQVEKPYDLIHANFWMSGLVAADIKRSLGLPFVITFHALGQVRRRHQGEHDEFPDARINIESRIVQEADGIVAECPQDKSDLINLYKADPSKIRLIPCGFDPHELWPVEKDLARKRIGLPEDEWIVLQLGRMVPRKGVETAIRGFARMVKEDQVAARMVIVGGNASVPDPDLTPEIGRLKKIAEEEGVCDRVLFTGRRGRQEIKHYFSAADVFISTPWYEPFGITPVESMACGTPVIGAEVGGIKYTVADGETGYLVPPEDAQAVAERLAELYQDGEKLKRFAEQSVKRVNELFTWGRISRLMVDFYEEVLSRCKLPRHLSVAEEANLVLHEDQRVAVEQAFEAALQTFQRAQQVLGGSILQCANAIIDCLERDGKVMVCGNGGSAADAQHFAAELVGRFVSRDRKGLPVLALTADTAFLTAWSNDVGYENIFGRQVEAFGQPGDLLIGISTSGRSRNLVKAFNIASHMNINRLALLGGDGGDLQPLSDVALVVPASNTQRIQEVQMLLLHLLCELVEQRVSARPLVPTKPLNGAPGNGSRSSWTHHSLAPVTVPKYEN